MLRRVGRVIRREDPDAEIVTAGLPDSRLGIGFEAYLRALMRGGGGDDFDALAIHPYARTAEGVVLAVRRARRLLTRLGHPEAGIWVTELGWASDGPPSPFTLGEDGQASEIERALGELRRLSEELGLRGVVYFNWRDAPPYAGAKDFWGLHTGLLDIDGRPKPALRAFEREVRTQDTPE